MGRSEESMADVRAGVEVGLMRRIWLGRPRGGEVTGVVKGDFWLFWLLLLLPPPAVPGRLVDWGWKAGWRADGFMGGFCGVCRDTGREPDGPAAVPGPLCWAKSGWAAGMVGGEPIC